MVRLGANMKVKVYHAMYGCESGCCGHIVELEDGRTHFEFEHPYEDDFKKFARDFAEETIRRRWPECLSTIDWDTMEINVSDD